MKKLILFIPFLFNLCFADTLTVFPESGTTVDGYITRSVSSETLSEIRSGTGTAVNDGGQTLDLDLTSSSTTDEYSTLRRVFMLFDTSSIGSGATIDTATLSYKGSEAAFNSFGGSPEVDIVSTNPASDDALVTGDFTDRGTTSFGSVAVSAWSSGSYNDFTLNASGESNINTTGISKFGATIDWDTDNSLGVSWASSKTVEVKGYSSDRAGTADDPKLVINYTPGASDNALFFGSGF